MISRRAIFAALLGSGLTFGAWFDRTTYALESAEATHKQVRTIAPEIDGSKASLHTYCVGPDNMLWMCCSSLAHNNGAIVVYHPDGTRDREIKLTFIPQAINFSPDGALFVAGSGKMAKLNQAGEILATIEAPNIGNKEEMMRDLKKAQEKQMETILASYKTQQERIAAQIAKLEEAPEEETEKQQAKRERRLKMLRNQQEQFDTMIDSFKSGLVAQADDDSMGRLQRSTAIAVTKQDVFVSLPETAGYGYSIWRLDHDLENPTVVIKGVGGCCGQLDIQCDEEHLLVAENTKFQVGVYDRDGKRLHGFGQRASGNDDGFGSCCNPMNVRYVNGEILTAESSIGDIKRYSPQGKLLGYIGRASVGGGCKHVAIGVDTSRNWHFMMVQDTSSVAVLVPKEDAPAETEDERISREAMETVGRKLFGTWELVTETKKRSGASASGEDTTDTIDSGDYISQMYGHMEFAPQGKLLARQIGPTASGGLAGVISAVVTAATTDEAGDQDPSNAIQYVAPTSNQEWAAIRVDQGKFEFVTIQERVRAYGATVEFVSDDEAKLTWFYGSSAQPMGNTLRYKRISHTACGKNCEAEGCAEGACADEGAKKSTTVPTDVSQKESVE